MRREHGKRRAGEDIIGPRATMIHHAWQGILAWLPAPELHKVPGRIESDHRSKEQSRSGIEDPAFWHQPPRTQIQDMLAYSQQLLAAATGIRYGYR